MIPVIAIVGRPNVGKSTLFNQLTRSRDALVADRPGLTRDRQYGRGCLGPAAYIVVDTGGLTDESETIDELMAQQTRAAIDESNLILFLVDARDGLNSADENILSGLRRYNKPIQLVMNKIDGINVENATTEFYSLGCGEPVAIAAAQNRGIRQMMEKLLEPYVEAQQEIEQQGVEEGIKVAIIGRPNVGKSTLVNRLLGEDRMVAMDMPGTTRDSIFIPFERDGQSYTLIDTAGVRRRSRVHDFVEKYSVIKAMQAIESANVVIMVLDARQEIADQDATLLGHVTDAGRALVLAVNKWDGLQQEQRSRIKSEIDFRLPYLDYADIHFISALHGTGVGNLFKSVRQAYRSATCKLATPELTRVLEQAVEMHQPPMVHNRRIKLRYAHQGGRNPPVIVIHGNQCDKLPEAYRRYLVNTFRKLLKLKGTPIRLEFKTGKNPYQKSSAKPDSRQAARKRNLAKSARMKK